MTVDLESLAGSGDPVRKKDVSALRINLSVNIDGLHFANKELTPHPIPYETDETKIVYDLFINGYLNGCREVGLAKLCGTWMNDNRFHMNTYKWVFYSESNQTRLM